MFRDLEPQLSQHDNLDDKACKELLRKIIDKANQDKLAFTRYVRGLYDTDKDRLDFMFQAIWTHPEGWDDFITKEIRRIFDLAEGLKDPKSLLNYVFFLTIVEGKAKEFYEKNIRQLRVLPVSLLIIPLNKHNNICL